MKKLLISITLLAMSLVMINCGEDDDAAPAKSRDIRFEVTGNFAGTLSATYVNANGGANNESIPSLPWTKNIAYASSVPSTGFTAAGTGGALGQALTIKVFAGNTFVSETSGTTDNSGRILVSAGVYIF